jgi:hypothetical protein
LLLLHLLQQSELILKVVADLPHKPLGSAAEKAASLTPIVAVPPVGIARDYSVAIAFRL